MKYSRVFLTFIQMLGVALSVVLLCLGIYIYDAVRSGLSLTLVIVAVVNFIFVVLIVVAVDYNIGEYTCPNCKKKFKPRLKDYVMGAHTMSARYLRCPECDKKSFCRVDYEKI